MKKSIISLLAILPVLFLSACSPTVLIKTSPEQQNVVLSSFRFHIEHFNPYNFYTGNFASLLVSASPPSMFNADLKQVYPMYSKKQNKMIKSEVDSTFDVIQNHLGKLNYNLLPANTLKGEAEYDPYGYPTDTKPGKAFKKADLALQVDIYIDEDFVNRFFAYPGLFQLTYTPRITTIMKMVNSAGKTVWSQQTITLAETPVTINDQVLGGLRQLTVNQKPELADIINQAMNEMLKKGLPKNQKETTAVG
ncbi:MAG TPA: hypothetical protein VKA08_03315 [Balneolales bacterium]|jgi:hypothetical protein|nr:hypothetical protein [Balneolales bacterium]